MGLLVLSCLLILLVFGLIYNIRLYNRYDTYVEKYNSGKRAFSSLFSLFDIFAFYAIDSEQHWKELCVIKIVLSSVFVALIIFLFFLVAL